MPEMKLFCAEYLDDTNEGYGPSGCKIGGSC